MAVGLKNDVLVFEFPEIHRDAVLKINFQRTLRIPDDGRQYPLPPGLGAFPLKDVDDLAADKVPAHWPRRGGVVMPMYQAEAMWIRFDSPSGYPFAVKIASGKVCAVTGKEWSEELHPARDGKGQDFLAVPRQPWLDGFCVKEGVVKQFVAMPLASHADYTVEKQVTGEAAHGGVQILVFPLKAELWEEELRRRAERERARRADGGILYAAAPSGCLEMAAGASFAASPMAGVLRSSARKGAAPDMGLGAGGRMKQDIYESDRGVGDFAAARSRCFVALANSRAWEEMTGSKPPHQPPSARTYASYGIPWYEWYDDSAALEGSEVLSKVRSVAEVEAAKGEYVLPDNTGLAPGALKTVPLKALPRSGAPVLKEGPF